MKSFVIALLLTSFFIFAPSYANAGPISEGFKTGNLCGFPGNACCDSREAIEASKDKAGSGFGIDQIAGFIYDRIFSVFNDNTDVINSKCITGIPEADPDTGACVCGIKRNTEDTADLIPLTTVCEAYAFGPERKSCLDCLNDSKFPTSFGCVDIDLADFISTYVLRTLLGAAGIYSLLSLLYASFKLQVSHGDKERITKAREMATASLMGLLLIIFSLFILTFIGNDILGLPGFK